MVDLGSRRMAQKLRIFVSSSGDVVLERNLAVQVVERLQGEFAPRVEIETIRWEDRPLWATESFQPQIIPPSETDIVICILWSRLGTPLPQRCSVRMAHGSALVPSGSLKTLCLVFAAADCLT